MKLNAKPLLEVKKIILKYPERYDQDYPEMETECGSAYCISGWIESLYGIEDEKHYFLGVKKGLWLNLIGLNGSGTRNWPPKYRNAYLNAKTAKGRARAGARMIDYFIKMNGEI